MKQIEAIEPDRDSRRTCIHLRPHVGRVFAGVQYLGIDFGGNPGSTARLTVQVCEACARKLYNAIETLRCNS